MTASDEDAQLAQFNEFMRRPPLHAHMDVKCLEHGPHTVATMELSDAVRGSANPLCRAVLSLFAKTMRAKHGQLEDGGAELGARP
jgi:hypothetical protein